MTPPGFYAEKRKTGIGLDWCKKKITKKFPNFKFQLADIHSKLYNPKGSYLLWIVVRQGRFFKLSSYHYCCKKAAIAAKIRYGFYIGQK